MRGGNCLKLWTKKQQVVSLSSAESELYAAVKTASEGLGVQSVAKDLGILCGLNLHLDASATMGLVNRRGDGQSEARRHAESVDTGGIQVRQARQLVTLMGYEFVKGETGALKGGAGGEMRLQ